MSSFYDGPTDPEYMQKGRLRTMANYQLQEENANLSEENQELKDLNKRLYDDIHEYEQKIEELETKVMDLEIDLDLAKGTVDFLIEPLHGEDNRLSMREKQILHIRETWRKAKEAWLLYGNSEFSQYLEDLDNAIEKGI